MTTRTLGIGLAAVGAAAAIWLAHRAMQDEPSDEELILELTEQVIAAAEKRDIKEIRRHVAADYQDDRGRGFRELNAYLVGHFLRGGTLSIYALRKDVTVDRSGAVPSARLEVTAVLTRGPKGKALPDVLPESARALAFDITLHKRDAWVVTKASWTDAPDFRRFLP